VTPPVNPDKAPLFSEDFCHPVNVLKTTSDSVWSGCIASTDTAMCANNAGCVWSSGKELIPDHDFCAPMDLTKDVQLIQKCLSAETAALCNQDCQWRHGTNTTTQPVNPGPAPLFTEDFCHPVNITKETPKSVWTGCISSKTTALCANNAGCNWSDGKEMIPDNEFCAPITLTNDVDLIQKCIEADSVTTCNEGCQWRQGRDSTGDNTNKPSTPLFSTEFCHPATVSKDTPIAKWTLCIASTDAADCSIASGCGWSDGKDLIPDSDFCAPLDLTNDVAIIKQCLSADAASVCSDKCQWRHGKTHPTTPTTDNDTTP